MFFISKEQGLKKYIYVCVCLFHNQLLIKTTDNMTVFPRARELVGTALGVEQKLHSQGGPQNTAWFSSLRCYSSKVDFISLLPGLTQAEESQGLWLNR